MNLFLDTSVIVKLYHHEEGTENLVNFLLRYSSDLILTISDLSLIEFRSVLLRRVREKEIDIDTSKQVFNNFDQDTELMNLIEINKIIKNRAQHLIIDHGSTHTIKTLDSLQLSSAIVANDNFPIDYFLAADTNLLDLAKLYFTIYNPLEIESPDHLGNP